MPWRIKWQPTPVFLPGESRGQSSLEGCSPWCRKESMTSGEVVEPIQRGVAGAPVAVPALIFSRELVSVQRVVALEERGAAAECARAAARDHGDRRPGAAAVLGLEVRRL